MVLLNSDTSSTSYNAQVFPDAHSVPTIHLPADYRDKLRTYIATKSRPIARIQGMSADYNATAPLVAEFSSVGPDAGPPGGVVLKPDLAAPGQNIIAAIPDTQNTYGYMFAMWSGEQNCMPFRLQSAVHGGSDHAPHPSLLRWVDGAMHGAGPSRKAQCKRQSSEHHQALTSSAFAGLP